MTLASIPQLGQAAQATGHPPGLPLVQSAENPVARVNAAGDAAAGNLRDDPEARPLPLKRTTQDVPRAEPGARDGTKAGSAEDKAHSAPPTLLQMRINEILAEQARTRMQDAEKADQRAARHAAEPRSPPPEQPPAKAARQPSDDAPQAHAPDNRPLATLPPAPVAKAPDPATPRADADLAPAGPIDPGTQTSA